MPQKLKLVYFNSRGRAEPIRLLLAAAKREYEDVRKTPEEWKEMKADTSFGHLPMLEIDGCQLGDSSAILRFLAKDCKMMGKNNLEASKIDQTYEEITEIRTKLIPIVMLTKEEDQPRKKEMLKKFKEEVLPTMLKTLEKELKKNKKGDGFFVGDKLSVADIQFFHIVEIISSVPEVCDAFSEKTENDYPKLFALNQRVADNPDIAAWLKKRPQTAN